MQKYNTPKREVKRIYILYTFYSVNLNLPSRALRVFTDNDFLPFMFSLKKDYEYPK